jgi:ectoine hydroxylase-related dioxygenase (phytanoyl-CoA dioxygenase family)
MEGVGNESGELPRFAAADLGDDPAGQANRDRLVEVVRHTGAAVVEGVLGRDALDRLNDELAPWIEASPVGRDGFTGLRTRRTGALVARSPACRELVMHPLVVGAAERFLGPHTRRIQLHLTQVITIEPGQGSQPLHRDRLAWGGHLPMEIEPQFNTIWALTDFTEENGATRVVPGSPSWDDDRRATDDEKTQAVMPAGSVLVYSGSVIHGGGENRSTADRIGLNITYCLGWLRTEENQYLSCPPDVARGLDPELQELIGYTMGDYALGYYSDPDAEPGTEAGSDLRPPERALGRRPRQGIGADESLTGD